ncbi:MAG: hypothetical protein IIY79_05100 [Ruminococcus sp.]|nr:hypothetical protein [Ruminococcus sp.]
MKCTHCGFTYDEETVCPICGTPAPVEKTRTESAVPPTAAQPQPPAPRTFRASAPSAPRHSERQSEQQSGGKGLRIATLCVLAVIALALICVALLQMISLLRDQKQKEPSPQIEETISLSSEPNTLQTDTEYITDKNIRRVGDSFDFGRGTVTLKSVTVTREKSTFSSKTQQVGFLLEINNNTKKEQNYDAPGMTLGSSGYDADHYAFAEFSLDQSSGSCTVQPGKSYYAMYYYNLPKENPEATAQVYVFGDSGSYTAATIYSLDLGSAQEETTLAEEQPEI